VGAVGMFLDKYLPTEVSVDWGIVEV